MLPPPHDGDRREHALVSDQARRDLYDALERELGGSPAETLMELLPPVGWADVARQSDLVAVRGEITQLRGEMGQLRGELKGEMAEVRGELARLNARIDAQIPRIIWANVPLALGVAGLVLAAAKLT